MILIDKEKERAAPENNSPEAVIKDKVLEAIMSKSFNINKVPQTLALFCIKAGLTVSGNKMRAILTEMDSEERLIVALDVPNGREYPYVADANALVGFTVTSAYLQALADAGAWSEKAVEEI